MLNSIWKYPVKEAVEMVKGARVLTVQIQREIPCIWAVVNPDEKETETHHFVIIGTGHKNEDINNLTYIGTVHQLNGVLIWHVFEKK